MCGICGFYNMTNQDEARPILQEMTNALHHRGPDGSGTWWGQEGSVGLGQTRLAIIDLAGGQQPMRSWDERYTIVFNGEIYNYQALGEELEGLGHRFLTNSDTEVIIEGFRAWGSDCVSRLHGMYAFAIYDTETGQLFLARDQTGIKPLFYLNTADGFFFGSELKSILTYEKLPRRLNHQAMADFFVLGCPVLPNTFFADIQEMEPGTWMLLDGEKVSNGRYWQWERKESKWGAEMALEQTETTLLQSLEEHLVADVPVGAFLSGGIDSSLLVALLSSKLGVKLDTFAVKFGEERFDEAPYARIVADQYGTQHHEILLQSSGGDRSVVEDVLDQFDQPFGDPSAIPVYLLSQEIRKHVKVVIGGDGGDEMFGGYTRFHQADMAHTLGRLPDWALSLAMNSIQRIGSIAYPEQARQVTRMFDAARRQDPSRLITLLYQVAPEEFGEVFQPGVMNQLNNYQPIFDLPKSNGRGPDGHDFIDSTIMHTMPSHYLRKVDMMSSAHGLEVRVPFLGAQVLSCAAQIPESLSYNRQTNKILLRRLAERYLPDTIVNRPKAGFEIPLDSWLGDSGRRAIQTELGSKQAYVRELINPEWIDTLMGEFITQKYDLARRSRRRVFRLVYFLWGVERWLQKWQPDISV